MKEQGIFVFDADDEVDDHCDAGEEDTTGHSFSVEHEEEGDVDEGRTGFTLCDNEEHGEEDDGASHGEVLPASDVEAI